MAESNLVLHTGGNLVTLDELRELRAPPPERKWHPISHATVFDRVQETLVDAGYEIKTMRLAVNGQGTRFFGTLDLASPVADGVALAVGIRNMSAAACERDKNALCPGTPRGAWIAGLAL